MAVAHDQPPILRMHLRLGLGVGGITCGLQFGAMVISKSRGCIRSKGKVVIYFSRTLFLNCCLLGVGGFDCLATLLWACTMATMAAT
jgi:hypothetical protein